MDDTRHVLVVGIDGVRFDVLRAVATPTLDAIESAGFLLPVRVNDANPSISGPVWATIATGLLSERHGVRDNDTPGRGAADFLSRIAAASDRTYAGVSWPPLVRAVGCGPLFRGGGYLPAETDLEVDIAGWEEADDRVAEHAAATLCNGDVAAAFIYFGLPDVVAHVLGTGRSYRAAVERSDERLGRVLSALRDRPRWDSERWAVVVATDHGHREAGGHGGDTDAERTAWIAGCGMLDHPIPEQLEQADIHAEVLTFLGVDTDRAAGAFGRPFGSRTADHPATGAGGTVGSEPPR